MRLPRWVPRRFPSRSPMRQVWLLALDLAIGQALVGWWLISGAISTDGPAFGPAKQVMPMVTWGVLLIGVGLGLLWCTLVPRTTGPAIAVLCISGPVHVALAASFLLAWNRTHLGLLATVLLVKLSIAHLYLVQSAAKRSAGSLYPR